MLHIRIYIHICTCFQYIILHSSISYIIYKSIDPFKAEKQNCQVPFRVVAGISTACNSSPAFLNNAWLRVPAVMIPKSPGPRGPGGPAGPGRGGFLKWVWVN